MSLVEKIYKHRAFFIFLLSILLILLIPLSISVGYYRASFIDVFRVLFDPSFPDDVREVLVLRARRALASVLIGFVLGASGAAMQAILRNPMASPFTLGISSAAALGVAIALLTGIGGYVQRWVISYNPYVIPFFAFLFAVIQVFIILLLAYRAGLSEKALILAAIATSFFYQALLYFVQYMFLNEVQIAMVVFWTFGDVGRVDWEALKVLAVACAILSVYFIARSIDFDLISLGDDIAYSSGVNPKRLRVEASLASAFGAAVVTSFAGVIAFLCLVSPHIARLVVGNSHKYLVPASMLVASSLLLVADAIGRAALSPVVLPVGITLSFIGSPLLLYLLLRR